MNYYYFDYSYILFMLPAFIISIYAQIKVSSAFNKYSKIQNKKGLTGADAAYKVLASNDVRNVFISHIQGKLSDNFDPRDNTIKLSDSVYDQNSIAAVGVAAHEAGHAVQFAQNYSFFKLRSALVPVTQFSSMISMPLFFIGLLLPTQYSFLLNVGIILFSVAVLFQLITLPVEFDASKRAIKALEGQGMLEGEELEGAKKVLKAAALTYVAATFTAILSLLRLLLIAGSRRGND